MSEFLEKLEQLLKEYNVEIEIDYGYHGKGEVYIEAANPWWQVDLGNVRYITDEVIAEARKKQSEKSKGAERDE